MTSESDLKEARRALSRRWLARANDKRFPSGKRVARAKGKPVARTDLNLLGTAVGSKISDGAYTGTRAVVVYVRKKQRKDKLPRRLRIPKTIDGIPVDVVETGEVKALAPPAACIANPAARQPRPFLAGVSLGGGDNPAGTFGYLVRLHDEPGEFLLSNFHVLGDLDAPQAKQVVFQPGSGDGPLHPSHIVGEFFRGRALDFGGGRNTMDAAVARARAGVALPVLCQLGKVAGVAATVTDDEIVSGYGKASRFMKGVVADVDVEIVVSYPGKRSALFEEQISIRSLLPGKPFSIHGDSGAILTNKNREACAMLFAGSAELSFATPLKVVLDALGAVLP